MKFRVYPRRNKKEIEFAGKIFSSWKFMKFLPDFPDKKISDDSFFFKKFSAGNPWPYILNSGLKVVQNFPLISPENSRTIMESWRNFVMVIEGIILGTFFSGIYKIFYFLGHF